MTTHLFREVAQTAHGHIGTQYPVPGTLPSLLHHIRTHSITHKNIWCSPEHFPDQKKG